METCIAPGVGELSFSDTLLFLREDNILSMNCLLASPRDKIR